MRIVAMGALLALGVLSASAIPASAQDPGLIEAGRRTFMNQGCYGCHAVGKVGTPIGPDLSHVGAKYRADYLERWLRDPSYVRPSTHMPALELSDDDIKAIAAFLASSQ
jgi:mono/diheme cytochrome c family protein